MSREVRFDQTGGPEVLRVVEAPEPHTGAGQVRVAVRAAGLNPFDTKVRSGAIAMPVPRGQGSEFAGVVDEVGAEAPGVDAPDVRVGDEVLGWIAAGAQADFVVVPASRVASKPPGLDWDVAGSLGLVANTASRAIAALGLAPGDTVFISGVGGGVGMLAAQFARNAGATVVGTASEDKHEFLRGIGVLPTRYGPGTFERLSAAAPGGFTAALDTVGEESVRLALSLGVPPERIDSVAYQAGGAELGILTVGGGKKTAAELAGFARSAAAGELVLPILATFPLEDVRSAYELLENGHGLGKIVLTMP